MSDYKSRGSNLELEKSEKEITIASGFDFTGSCLLVINSEPTSLEIYFSLR